MHSGDSPYAPIDHTGRIYPLDKLKARLGSEGGKFTLFGKFQDTIPSLDPESIPHVPEYSTILGKKPSWTTFLTAVNKKILTNKNVPRPLAEYIAERMIKNTDLQDFYSGKWGQTPAMMFHGMTPEDQTGWYYQAWQRQHGINNVTDIDSKYAALDSNIRQYLIDVHNHQRAIKMKVRVGKGYGRDPIDDPNHIPNVMSKEVIHTLTTEPPTSEAVKHIRQLWFDWVKMKAAGKIKDEEIRQMFDDYRTALGNDVTGNIEYNALIKAEGYGLPFELMEKSPAEAFSRYGHRVAKHFAYFETIQGDPAMRKALNINDAFGKRPDKDPIYLPDGTEVVDLSPLKEIKDAKRLMFGQPNIKHPRVIGLARVIGSAIMGFGTGARDTLNIPATVLPYLKFKDFGVFVTAATKLKQARIRAFQSNAVRLNMADYQIGGAAANNPDRVMGRLNQLADIFRRYQGRDFMERFNRIYTYSIGEELAIANVARAIAGDGDGLRFITRFGNTLDKAGELVAGKRKVTQEDISRLAKNVVNAAQGSYGPNGLPAFSIDGEFAPFFALSRWSIEKANVIWQDAVVPAMNGNVGPLLKYALGSLVTGVAIEQLNELLSKKRGAEPTLNEIAYYDEATAMDRIYKTIGLLQLGSFAGIVGDAMKIGSNLAQGTISKYTNPISFPLYSWIVDTVANNVADASAAIQDGGNPVDIAGQFGIELLRNSFQNARYVYNWVEESETKRKERFRDVGVFKKLAGLSTPNNSSDLPNPYLNSEIKKFKRTDDYKTAIELLPGLISHALAKADGDLGRLVQELDNIKHNSYQTMPNPKTLPTEFLKYVQFLQNTQGREAAQKRLTDYLLQNALNKAKSDLIPTVKH